MAKVETLGIYKSLEVVVINENKNLIFVTLQVVMSNAKHHNNIPQLLFINLVTSLYKDYFFGKKDYRVLFVNFGLRKIRIIFISYMIGRILI